MNAVRSIGASTRSLSLSIRSRMYGIVCTVQRSSQPDDRQPAVRPAEPRACPARETPVARNGQTTFERQPRQLAESICSSNGRCEILTLSQTHLLSSDPTSKKKQKKEEKQKRRNQLPLPLSTASNNRQYRSGSVRREEAEDEGAAAPPPPPPTFITSQLINRTINQSVRRPPALR